MEECRGGRMQAGRPLKRRKREEEEEDGEEPPWGRVSGKEGAST